MARITTKRKNPGRPEQEGEDERRNDEEMRDALGARRADLPRADEQVEGEIVQPAGEEQSRRLEEQADIVERREASLGVAQNAAIRPA